MEGQAFNVVAKTSLAKAKVHTGAPRFKSSLDFRSRLLQMQILGGTSAGWVLPRAWNTQTEWLLASARPTPCCCCGQRKVNKKIKVLSVSGKIYKTFKNILSGVVL